ncbi:MAG: mannose-1-phosphate guanylyltransferase [Bacteroidales bacterium]|nr:mannose-1-phosphate guanylyltransferase [Bacteroidales bacterium]
MNTNTNVVIMAGGIGSRFWPMSTPEFPKQFVDVLGRGRTMIQMTVERFAPLCPLENVWVVTSEDYVDIVKSQIPQIPESNILAEPCARNTAPCIAYACWKIMLRHPSANIVVTPSDALVTDVEEFRRIIRNALAFASEGERVVTLGVKPTRPETGYGYIAASGRVDGSEICAVESFREKPDLETARRYLEAGNYFWNAGIFVWNVETIVSSIRRFTPDLASRMDRMAESFYTLDEKKVVEEIFPTCEKISIDYAVMEKADYIYTYPSDFGWSDVGTWGSLWTLLPHDDNGNAVVGENVHLYECRGCIVHAPDASSVVLEGIEDSIVVERAGRILVCRLSEEQRIKEFKK